MTEAQWLASADPAAMLQWANESPGDEALRGGGLRWPKISDRKLRLFACAVARQVWDRLVDDAPCEWCEGKGCIFPVGKEIGGPIWPFEKCLVCHGTGRVNRSRRAVEVAEQFADGEATVEEVRTARNVANEVGCTPGAADEEDDNGTNGGPCYSCLAAETLAADISFKEPWFARCLPPATQAALLREIVGNPWRPYRRFGNAVCDGSMKELFVIDGTVRRMAEGIYAERAFDRLPILADALEDAGCDDADVLAHCRTRERCPNCINGKPRYAYANETWMKCTTCDGAGWIALRGPHCRGCWVIDLLTGRA